MNKNEKAAACVFFCSRCLGKKLCRKTIYYDRA